jgi:Protein of unknown function (DUF3489)
MCCFRRTHSSLKWAPEASGIRSLSNTPGSRPGDTHACDFRLQILLASTRQKSESWDAPGDTGSAKEQNRMDSVFFLTAEDQLARVEDRMEPPDGCVTFASERQLFELAQDWPLRRLVRLWNALPGVQPVQRFENRAIATSRLWRALQPGEPQPARSAWKPGQRALKSLPRHNSKAATILNLLARPQGATVLEIMSVTQWQAHSVRGFISGNLGKKRQLKVRSFRRDGQHAYRVLLRGSAEIAVGK